MNVDRFRNQLKAYLLQTAGRVLLLLFLFIGSLLFSSVAARPGRERMVESTARTETDGPVRIVLQDVLGHRVGSLFEGYLPFGDHTMSFDVSMFSTGQYFCQVIMGNKVLRDKLIISKNK